MIVETHQHNFISLSCESVVIVLLRRLSANLQKRIIIGLLLEPRAKKKQIAVDNIADNQRFFDDQSLPKNRLGVQRRKDINAVYQHSSI